MFKSRKTSKMCMDYCLDSVWSEKQHLLYAAPACAGAGGSVSIATGESAISCVGSLIRTQINYYFVKSEGMFCKPSSVKISQF